MQVDNLWADLVEPMRERLSSSSSAADSEQHQYTTLTNNAQLVGLLPAALFPPSVNPAVGAPHSVFEVRGG